MDVLTAATTFECAGLLVRRPFPARGLMDPHPFPLLDEMGPVELGPNEAKRAPDNRPPGLRQLRVLPVPQI